ncbi:MAG: HypC/HybG/HupF family hydrogenase formation chaperone [Lachnospiraceae bacterium]|jgi:hydrogenase expression/formation protein HypC
MCLAVPLKITNIEGSDAIAERDGVQRKIRLDFISNPKVGEYVLVHAGFAIERLSKDQALAGIAAAKEVEQALAEIGRQSSGMPGEGRQS